jgi:UDP-N-acetylmuramate--alanine ligase
VCVTDIYAAREDPVGGVTGKLVVDALARRRPGMWIAWAPTLHDAARMIEGRARAGDVVVTVGAGNVDDAAETIVARLEGRLPAPDTSSSPGALPRPTP